MTGLDLKFCAIIGLLFYLWFLCALFTFYTYTRLQTVWSLPGHSRQANKGHSPRCHRRPNGPGRLADKVVQPTTQSAEGCTLPFPALFFLDCFLLLSSMRTLISRGMEYLPQMSPNYWRKGMPLASCKFSSVFRAYIDTIDFPHFI